MLPLLFPKHDVTWAERVQPPTRSTECFHVFIGKKYTVKNDPLTSYQLYYTRHYNFNDDRCSRHEGQCFTRVLAHVIIIIDDHYQRQTQCRNIGLTSSSAAAVQHLINIIIAHLQCRGLNHRLNSSMSHMAHYKQKDLLFFSFFFFLLLLSNLNPSGFYTLALCLTTFRLVAGPSIFVCSPSVTRTDGFLFVSGEHQANQL